MGGYNFIGGYNGKDPIFGLIRRTFNRITEQFQIPWQDLTSNTQFWCGMMEAEKDQNYQKCLKESYGKSV